ncbi:MAG: hypothetical protein KDD60_02130 [Bdellovibrionales bacterium]|nr:hypothetical protein [Bdellovibrionales bacterium]
MRRIVLDKIASATKNVPLPKEVRVSDNVIAEAGYILAGRLHGTKTVYNEVENCSGRFIRLHEGDIIAGVLGHRDALKGYSGRVPEKISVGDKLQVLNLGGVIGECTSENPEVGKPFDFEVLGSIQVFPQFESRQGENAHVRKHSQVKLSTHPPQHKVPVVYIAGTCMQAGKTSAATRIVRGLRQAGLKVGACKLTGVSLLRDTLEMTDYGANWAYSFIDSGVVTTDGKSAVPAAYNVISTLIDEGAEIIVAELGDGIVGTYGVKEILAEKPLMDLATALVLCANDPVGAWGAVEILEQKYQLRPQVISGPTTDNLAGINYIENELNVRAINARKQADELCKTILALVESKATPSTKSQ